MRLSKKQFIADVTHEINTLKKHATKEELKKLVIGFFNPFMADTCIYGQMTGNCSSFRAKELMDKSCIRTTKPLHNFKGVSKTKNRDFKSISNCFNKNYDGETWGRFFTFNKTYNRHFEYTSALELYISLNGANNKNILAYLRGETEDLILNTI